MYKELQELGKFMARASGLLADLHQLLITVTMATAPQVIEFFMTLFCNTTRIVLLMERVPWRLLVQVYTIVTATLDNSSPPGRTAVCELLEKLQEPVTYMQELFQPISSRVSQILELAVSAVLDHVPTARVLECSSVFDVSRLGQTQLGITGLSLQRTFSFLQRLDDFRSWAQLGFLACPAALQGVNAQSLLAALLRESFLLPLYGDVVLPLHSMYQQHVTPALEQLVCVLLDSSGNKAAKQQQVQEARQLVGKCYQSAVDTAEAEHAARRRYICRVLQDLLVCCEDDASLLPEALPMALAAQAYAKSELLWYFRHVAEVLPAAGSGAAKLGLPLLSEKPGGPQLSEDAHVVTLVAATTAVYDLLEEHQGVLQGCQLATMRALLEQQVLPETAAVLATSDRNAQVIPTTGKDRVVPRILVPLVKAVVYPLAELAHAEDATLLLGRPESPVQHQQADISTQSLRRQSTAADRSSAAARDSDGGGEASSSSSR
ncbi:membrane-associated apoptosis protein-domain-containing protein [Scenedesmus sp. NREL 46B-D3]|nr:membrane-associated apoptosis protein-domain-containing protein [Scenedesmus sp. NREL 46B-D3]